MRVGEIDAAFTPVSRESVDQPAQTTLGGGARLVSAPEACSRARARDERGGEVTERIGWGGCGGNWCPDVTGRVGHIITATDVRNWLRRVWLKWCPEAAPSCWHTGTVHHNVALCMFRGLSSGKEAVRPAIHGDHVTVVTSRSVPSSSRSVTRTSSAWSPFDPSTEYVPSTASTVWLSRIGD